jgi:secreted PhoX family phosphatase
MDRRSFLSGLAYFSGGLALAGSSLSSRAVTLGRKGEFEALRAYGYGKLTPTVASNTGELILALPPGFQYKVIGRAKDVMSDGRPTPPLHDGQHTFKVGRELRIVRNHEVSNLSLPRENAGIGRHNHYDETAGGGTTTMVIDAKTNSVVRDWVSLSGTLINCAGGPTPWGSWISCEETTLGKTVRTRTDGRKTGGFTKPHGYCFEVPAAHNSEVLPVPLKAMGRFVHEAIAVDRKSSIVYLTEDFNPSGFYRFLPKRKGHLIEGGTLQMLVVEGKPSYDTRTGQKIGQQPLPASWVTIDDPDPEVADVDPSAVHKQGAAKGGAAFNRLEGCEIDDKGNVYFSSTSGGDTRGGQIWVYSPDGRDRGHLRLAFQSPDPEILHMPDNLCMMPHTDLLVICEDSNYGGEKAINHLRILTGNGQMADFAVNINKDFPRSEFAGSCFSPDGDTLFVNSQTAGITLAITGDWKKFKA